MKVLNSPKENVAQQTLLAVANATTRIKELITASIIENKSQEELTKALNKTIDVTCKLITNPELREQTRNALVTSSRKWYYQLNQTVNILNRNLANKVKGFKAGTYTGDINALFENVEGIRLQKIRPYLDVSTKGLAVIEDYDKKLKLAMKALAAEPPLVAQVEGKKAYTVSLRNRAEMTVRYEANLSELKEFIASGVEFVWTTSHPDASPRCAKHQGKLYSLNADNKQGIHNGIPYTYLPDVLKLNNGNSIINGYNCRHRLVAYEDDSHPPKEYTSHEIKREYANDQKQRTFENNIRQLKTEERLMRASGDVESAQKLRLRWRKLNTKYQIDSLKMGRAFYRWRTIVSDDEKYYNAKEE